MNQLIVHVKRMEEVGGLDVGMKHEIEEILACHWPFVHSPLHATDFVWKEKGFHIIRNKFFFPDIRDQASIKKQLAFYKNTQGLFVDPIALIVAKETLAHVWWSLYGAETPQLQTMAIKVLGDK